MELRASPPTRRPHHGAAPSLEALATRNRVYHRIVSSICRTAIDHWHTPLGAEREGPRYRCDGSVVGQLEAMLCQQATEDDFHLVNREGGPDGNAGRQDVTAQCEGLLQSAGRGRYHGIEAQGFLTHGVQVREMHQAIRMGWAAQRAQLILKPLSDIW